MRGAVNLKKKYGEGWAIITGGSSGIGLNYARYVAAQGYKTLLLGNKKEELEEAANNITNQYNVESRAQYFDFSVPCTEQAYSNLRRIIHQLDAQHGGIALLFNNVGMGGLSKFEEYSYPLIEKTMNVNVAACTAVSRLVIPNMLARYKEKKVRAGIVFVSSAARYAKIPYMSIYVATKAYVHALSNTLAMEYKEQMDILCISPGPVDTPLNPGKGGLFISAQEAARTHLRCLGRERNADGCWKHEAARRVVAISETTIISMMHKELEKDKIKKMKAE